mmetsp:Transcript_4532/g.9047  ORF Transcript_4532/g.9047 Transcript_4532/m.9047 type:complete len:114 (-) Transcript_4532:323-664(-)
MSFDILFVGLFPRVVEVLRPLLPPTEIRALRECIQLVTGGRQVTEGDLLVWIRETMSALPLPELRMFPITDQRLQSAAGDCRRFCQNPAFEPTEALCLSILAKAFDRPQLLGP